MTRTSRGRPAVLAVALLLVALPAAVARAQAGGAAGGGTVVLDTVGVWRIHSALAPPVLAATGQPAVLPAEWLNFATPRAPEGWTAPEFDDRFWHRGPAGLAPKTALLSQLCLRGKFTVTDPAAVRGLSLSATYRGGLVISLNGREVRRENVAPGAALADGPAGEERRLSACALPLELLRPGLNVLTVEGVRAPYPPAAPDAPQEYRTAACEISRIRLIAPDPAGLVPCVSRPRGLQVWNADAMASDFNLDFGDRAEPLYPVTIVAARNGAFSGKVTVGSPEPIRGLTVVPGELRGEAGAIPASDVHVRYALPWGNHLMTDVIRIGMRTQESPYPTYATLLSALADKPLPEFPVMPPAHDAGQWCRDFTTAPGQPAVVPGAVVPVWITVDVPREAGAGTYTGAVQVAAGGQAPVSVPVEVRVADYALPDTQDDRTFVDLIQSPDTLALEYDVPLWSDRHFELIAESFRVIGETGCRTLYVPLIATTSLGNAESMVRWIKHGDGYTYDFSTMERYVDVAVQNMGRPKQIVFVAWEVYMLPTDKDQRKDLGRLYYLQDKLEAGQAGKGPLVTVVDPATGTAENVFLPPHSDPSSLGLWKPLFDELHARLRHRGLDGAMMLGIASDMWPAPEDAKVFNEAAGDVPWAIQSHSGYPAAIRKGERLHGILRFGYQAFMYGLKNPVWPSLRGWAREQLVARFDRRDLDMFPSTAWRHLVEPLITGDQRGVGRLGADYWLAVRNAHGARAGRAQDRYPESHIQKLGINAAALAPGPDGPVATQHSEALREGVQECEARITIEGALADPALRARLGQDLAGRCEEYLKARSMMLWLSLGNLQLYSRDAQRPQDWMALSTIGSLPSVSGHSFFLSSDYQQQTAELFALAGEVARKTGGP